MQTLTTLSGVQARTTRRSGTQVLQLLGMGISPVASFSTMCKAWSRSPGSWMLIQKAFIFLIHRFAVLPTVSLQTQTSWQPQSGCCLPSITVSEMNPASASSSPATTAHGLWFPATPLSSSPAAPLLILSGLCSPLLSL